ncbi:hypothetical protein [Rhodocyclus gracilis]|nr:hypothetical protein [Rhodocyclus gracilis]
MAHVPARSVPVIFWLAGAFAISSIFPSGRGSAHFLRAADA